MNGAEPSRGAQKSLRPRVTLAVACWLVAIGAVMAALLRHEHTPGPAGAAVIAGAPAEQPRAMLFAHPHCPCTRASIEEFSRLARRAERGAFEVWFFRPENEPDSWAHGAAWNKSSAIEGARIAIDPEGREAARWGALTSGHVVVVNEAGEIAFTGGVTASRGHEGGNAGADGALKALRGEPGPRTWPVFGCRIQSEHEEE